MARDAAAWQTIDSAAAREENRNEGTIKRLVTSGALLGSALYGGTQ
jgi:hypothetical protein